METIHCKILPNYQKKHNNTMDKGIFKIYTKG